MAHLYRLIVAALLLWCGAAHATIPTVNGYKSPADNVTVYLTVEAACRAWIAGAANASTYNYYDNIGLMCRVIPKAGGAVSNWGSVISSTGACPANSTANGSGSCTCTAPAVEDSTHTSCVTPPDPCVAIKGAIEGEIEWASTTKGNNYGCLGGEGNLASCQTVAVCDYATQVPGQIGYTCRGNSYANGTRSSMCSGTGATPESPSKPPVPSSPDPQQIPVAGQPAPARCPAGQAPGTFNGTSMCQPVGGDTQTSSPAPGTGTTTTNNSDGSSTTSTTSGTTSCLQGQCTTTINNSSTVINAPGNSTCPAGQTSGTTTVGGASRTTCTGTTSSTGTQAQTEFCKNNPKDKQCGGDGADTSFGGSCAGGYKAVSDDAVLNAMAEEQYRRNCQVFKTDSAEGVVVAAASDSTGLLKATTPGDSTVNIGSGNFDQSSAIGGGSCNLNKTITVAKMTATLPFNVICDPLAYLGEVLVAVSLLLAARIVARG